jgi:hypothetical protein
MRLALLDYWNASVRGAPMRVVLAYANRLRMLPTYLQQLEMESNGKSVGPRARPCRRRPRRRCGAAKALWGSIRITNGCIRARRRCRANSSWRPTGAAIRRASRR